MLQGQAEAADVKNGHPQSSRAPLADEGQDREAQPPAAGRRALAEDERRVPDWLRAGMAALGAGIVLSAVAVASERDAPLLGFLMWFRHEGRGVAGEGTLLFCLFGVAIALTCGAFASGGHARLFETAANVAMKLTLLAAAAFMIAFPDLPQFENKSLIVRAILYPVLAALIPAAYAIRHVRGRYPTLIDLCWTLALANDIVGNDLHWYGNWRHWDDTVHFLNAVPIMFILFAGVMTVERRGVIRVGIWGGALFALALYTSLHGCWETAEFLMDRYTGTELQPGGMAEATRNNLSSILGSLVAVALLWFWERSGFIERSFVGPLASFTSQILGQTAVTARTVP
jgi:hypothetical protein